MSNLEPTLRTIPEIFETADTQAELTPMEQLELSREIEAEGFAVDTQVYTEEFQRRKAERTELKGSEEEHLVRKLAAIEAAQQQLEAERSATIEALNTLRATEGETQ